LFILGVFTASGTCFLCNSMQIIVQSLRDMAIERTVANSNPKETAAAVAAAKATNAPAAELTDAVNRVATSLSGVYMLASLGNPTLDPFRCDCFYFCIIFMPSAFAHVPNASLNLEFLVIV
jgi:hypothetical protein